MSVYAELEGDRIEITYSGFNPNFLKLLKKLKNSHFKAKPYPHWWMKKDIESAKMLRGVFGEELELGPLLKRWAKETMRKQRNLAKIALADTAELQRLPEVLPELGRKIHVGPRGVAMTKREFLAALKEPPSYQAADVLFMATADNPMNLNQPGTGKTLTTIGAIYEGALERGPKLIVAPMTSLDVVWEEELTRYTDQPVLRFGWNKNERIRLITQATDMVETGDDFWMVVNPQSFQYNRTWEYCDDHAKLKAEGVRLTLGKLHQCIDCKEVLTSEYPEVLWIPWSVAVVDEFDKMGLGNPDTLTYQTLEVINATKKMILSGTPIGGVPIKLFGILSYLHPDIFTSKWGFANQWLDVTKESYELRGEEKETRVIGDVREDREQAFYEMLSSYMVRRTKEECLPWLPPKLYIEIKAEMSGKQEAQYREFAREAEIRIDEEELNATSVLAEYTRLKQFANAAMTILGRNDEGRPILRPTTDSCKLPHVIELLEERGIKAKGKSVGDQQVVIFSQFTQIVDMITEELQRLGYPAEKLTGATRPDRRADLQRGFQAGKFRVLVMNVKAGGVSITLDMADTVIFLDETWNPDDQEQAEDRIHRASRIHQVTVYYIRTKKTIEQYIQAKVLDKSRINKNILDLRRMGLRADKG